MLIGRERERTLLNSAVNDKEPHFIAVYGRRRIGKTYLVREVFGNRFTFQHTGIANGSFADQLGAFHSSLRDYGLKAEGAFHSWYEAFDSLKDLIRNSSEKRKVVFIDELSWMDTPRGNLISALEHFWNGWASSRKDVVLIICASATAWMLNKVIHDKGGLYHRLTEQIHLKQFCLSECEDYIRARGLVLTRLQILQYYMIFGGVPFYWTFLEKGLSLSQNIDRILFSEEAPLKDEFEYLYASIFKKPESYLEIVRALGKKKIGMVRDEIIEATGKANSGELTKKLSELESCGFIRKYRSFGKEKKDSLYQLIDFFTLFHFMFLLGKPTDENFWSNQINTPVINTWLGLAFERVCMEHVPQMKQKLGISGVLTDVCSLYCKADPDKGIRGSQIDLLIVRRDQVINLCEMKYSATEYSITESVDMVLRRKINDLILVTGTKHAVFPTLVTTLGLNDNMYSGNIQSVITLDDLFARN